MLSWLISFCICYYVAERLGRGIVTDGITTPVVNKKPADLIDFKVLYIGLLLFYLMNEFVTWKNEGGNVNY
jgi:hypothetical protein